jgi:Tfp pilus assembly protein PilV
MMTFPHQYNSLLKTSKSFVRLNCGGALLIEVLIATAIFSIGVLAVGTLLMAAGRANSTSNIYSQALLLAAATLESLKIEPIGRLYPNTYNDSNNPINEWGNHGGIFTRKWVIDDPLGFNTSRRIRVTVSWDRQGHTREVVLTTITRGKES